MNQYTDLVHFFYTPMTENQKTSYVITSYNLLNCSWKDFPWELPHATGMAHNIVKIPNICLQANIEKLW